MYTLSLNSFHNIRVFRKEVGAELDPWIANEISEARKAELITIVEQALGTGPEAAKKNEVIALTMKSELDKYLNDPATVLKMIEYAQEKGKSALIVIAISKRFATLIQDPVYFTELSNIENRLIKNKKETIGLSHEWSNQIKATVQSRVKRQVI